MSVGSGATVEEEVDTTGFLIDGEELVIGDLKIGDGARVGTRSLLLPGCNIGEGAEILPGSVVDREIPAGELWGGSPIASIGPAGETWPDEEPELTQQPTRWKVMYGVGLILLSLLPFLAALPGLLILISIDQDTRTLGQLAVYWLIWAVPISLLWIMVYNLLIAVTLRLSARLMKPGFHSEHGGAAWAHWFSVHVMEEAHMFLRSIFSSIYTASWLRLLGVKVGKGTEVSITSGLNSRVAFKKDSFVADDVLFATARHRRGWIHLQGIEVGNRTFLGNSVIVEGGTTLGDDSLVGVLSTSPENPPDGTSWLGMPALELPRVAEAADLTRTMNPPVRLKIGRAIVDGIRILLPELVSVMLATVVIVSADIVADSLGSLWWMALWIPFALFGVGILSLAIMVILKWLIMGRYKPTGHPLWSFFCWRDEIINVMGEVVAGFWMFPYALGTPIMPWYFRAMGAKVGKNLWCDMINITEFDVVTIGDNVTLNAGSCLETHLFHDRVMKIGPTDIGDGATLGPNCAVLPDTVVGEGCRIAGRSVVMRGESLPPHTSWQGAPVVSA
jgi:non-ribosomal peptide synthetase-like protein